MAALPRADGGDLGNLAAMRAELDAIIERRVIQLRQRGWRSGGAVHWSVIGDALGMTPQGAQQRYRDALKKQERYPGSTL